MSGRWLDERKRDPYHRMAKEQGYRSRAVYKLKEIDQRFRIFRDAEVVLDLGAAPGGWLQVASQALDGEGLVLGVDLVAIDPLVNRNVKTVQGDIAEDSTLEQVRRLLPGPVDVLLSDLSPQVSGIWDLDHYRQLELARRALRYADEFLKPGGWIVLKIFQGAETDAFLRSLRRRLSFMKIFHPRATRKKSAESYVIGRTSWRVRSRLDYEISSFRTLATRALDCITGLPVFSFTICLCLELKPMQFKKTKSTPFFASLSAISSTSFSGP